MGINLPLKVVLQQTRLFTFDFKNRVSSSSRKLDHFKIKLGFQWQ